MGVPVFKPSISMMEWDLVRDFSWLKCAASKQGGNPLWNWCLFGPKSWALLEEHWQQVTPRIVRQKSQNVSFIYKKSVHSKIDGFLLKTVTSPVLSNQVMFCFFRFYHIWPMSKPSETSEVARSELMFRCLDRERPPKVPRYAKEWPGWLGQWVMGQWWMLMGDGSMVLHPNDESVKWIGLTCCFFQLDELGSSFSFGKWKSGRLLHILQDDVLVLRDC